MKIVLFSDLQYQRFLSHVKKTETCWEWVGFVKNNGYGSIGVAGETCYAHRLMWQFVNGSIPTGLFVLHKCDNRRCVNPDHLFLGTHTDNMRDMAAKKRQVFQVNPDKAPRGIRHRTCTKPELTPKGTRYSNAKLDEVKIADIHKRHANGESEASIARLYNVSRGLIYHVLKGRAWKHVLGDK